MSLSGLNTIDGSVVVVLEWVFGVLRDWPLLGSLIERGVGMEGLSSGSS